MCANNPHSYDVLHISGVDTMVAYLIQEILKAYRQQDVDITDKHIEVIVRQMMRKVHMKVTGDTKLPDNSAVDVLDLNDANAEIDRRNAVGERGKTDDPLCTRWKRNC